MTGNFNNAAQTATVWGKVRGWLASVFADEEPSPQAPPQKTLGLREIFNEIAGRKIETERLVLRRWTDGDAQAVADFLNRDDGAFQTYLYGQPAEHFDANLMRDHMFSQMKWEMRYKLAVFSKESAKIIGVVGFWEDTSGGPRLTYFISPGERGHGYAFEAYMAELKEFAGYGAVTEMIAEVLPENHASQNLLKKAGFVPVKTIIADSGSSKDGEETILFRRDMSDLTPRPAEAARPLLQ